MSNLERKVDAMIRVVMADDSKSRDAALNELRAVAQTDLMSPLEEDRAEQILMELGVPCSIRGYYDLIAAIRIVKDDTHRKLKFVSGVYPRVAEELGNGRTATRVERAIRHAIEVACDRGNPDVFPKYFGNTISAAKGKPTNSEFISRIALVLRKEEACAQREGVN